MPDPLPPLVIGGPLADERAGQVHSLVVYLKGDGMHAVDGFYVRSDDDGALVWQDWDPGA